MLDDVGCWTEFATGITEKFRIKACKVCSKVCFKSARCFSELFSCCTSCICRQVKVCSPADISVSNKIRLSGSALLLFFSWVHAEKITDRELNIRVHRKFGLKFVIINRYEWIKWIRRLAKVLFRLASCARTLCPGTENDFVQTP